MTLLGEILLQSGLSIAETLLARKGDFVARATATTAEAYAHIEGVQQSLTTWCDSEDFAKILEALKSGSREIHEKEVVGSFVRAAQFYHGNETETVAEELVTAFLRNVLEQLLQSQLGNVALAARLEVLHTQTKDEVLKGIRQESQLVQEGIAREISRIPSALPPDAVSESEKVQGKVLHARLDAARGLLEKGRPVSAREVLEQIRKDVAGKSVAAEIHFRIAINLGACALQLDEIGKASEEFARARTLFPDHPKALANSAAIELLRGNASNALDLATAARSKDRDPYGTAITIESLVRLRREADMRQLLQDEQWIENDATCTLAIGKAYYEAEDFGVAERHLRRSHAIDSTNPRTMTLLALALLGPIKRLFMENPPLPWRVPAEVRSTLSEAHALLTQAANAFESVEHRSSFAMVLSNRAVVSSLLGEFDAAQRDYDRILAEPDRHDIPLRNKGMLLLRMDRPGDAALVLEQVEDPSERAEVRLSLALAYAQTKNYAKAAKILEELWDSSVRDEPMLAVADLLMLVLHRMGRHGEVDPVIEQVQRVWPGDPDALAAIAHEKHRQGNDTEALSLLQEAVAYSSGNQRDRAALELADLYYSVGQFPKAAEQYRSVVDASADREIVNRFLVSLYNSGMYSEALDLARAIRKNGPPAPVVSEVEAQVLEYIGDLKGAKAVWEGLVQQDPLDVEFKIRIVMLDLRRGDVNAARDRLMSLHYDLIKDNPQALMAVAQARHLVGEGGVLPLLHRARRVGFNDPENHLAYIGFFLNRDPGEVPSVDLVSIDTTAYLERDGTKIAFTIVDDLDADRARDELRAADPLAQKLLGHRRGDIVNLKQGPLEELSYRIVDVQSKYVHAFRESLENFGTWFPQHPGLHRFKVEQNDFSAVFAVLDERYKLITGIREVYRGHRFTMGTISSVLKTPLVEVWAGMISSKDERLIASTGDPAELAVDVEAIGRAGSIAVDTIALLTIAYLGLLDRIPKRFVKFLVSQSSLDDLTEALARNYLGARPAGFMWREGERYVRQETTQEGFQKGRAFLESTREFVLSTAEIVPVSSALGIGRAQFEEFREVIGTSSVSAALVAKEHSLLLYSDDLHLRQISKSEWGVHGIWSQPILLDLEKRGIIAFNEYSDAIRKLILANYHFVSVNDKTLEWILRRGTSVATAEIERVLRVLWGPECNEDSAINVIADLLRSIWLDGFLYQQKLMLLDLCLGALCEGRSPQGVLAKLKLALRGRFSLMPAAFNAVLKNIDLWEKTLHLRSSRLVVPHLQ